MTYTCCSSFKKQQANIVKPILQIDGITIESVDHFNFLGLTLDSRMTWNNHTTNISNKCSSFDTMLTVVLCQTNAKTAHVVAIHRWCTGQLNRRLTYIQAFIVFRPVRKMSLSFAACYIHFCITLCSRRRPASRFLLNILWTARSEPLWLRRHFILFFCQFQQN